MELNTRDPPETGHAPTLGEAIRRVLAMADYMLVGKALWVLPFVSIPAHFVFYFTCRFQGYWESFPLRALAAASTVPLLFYPRNGRLGLWRRLYYESALLAGLPVMFTWFYLQNGQNTYWFVSLMWSGLVYGAASGRAWYALTAFPLSLLLTGALHRSLNPSETLNMVQVVGSFSITWLSAVTMAAMRLAADAYYLISLDLREVEIRAAEAERSRDVLEAKNVELTARNATISTFVRPSLLGEVSRGEDPLAFAPRIVDKTIMICDMRDFTPLTATMVNAGEQAAFINGYFEMMIEPVFACGGEVDKLMGDALMAIFPEGDNAVKAASTMRLTLQARNRELYKAGHPTIGNVTSLAKGVILEANIGGRKKLDRTWIGAAVNVASRLQSIAKHYGVEILAGDDLIDGLPDLADCRLIDIVKVKGYDRRICVYELYGHQASEVVKVKNDMRGDLRRAIELYFAQGRLHEAAVAFAQLLAKVPPHRFNAKLCMDGVLTQYAARCAHRLTHEQNARGPLDLANGCHDFSSEIDATVWTSAPHAIVCSELSAALRAPENG